MEAFLRGLPKAELHVHIEGTLEPELLFEMAARNSVPLRYDDVDELRAAYRFSGLQDFLDVYNEGATVLQTSRDFTELAIAYLERAAADGVRRAEIFFDPQTHTERGIAMGAVVEGLAAGCAEAGARLGVSTGLIPCFVRHLPQESAMEALEAALAHREHLLGVGLDSTELGHPPSEFADVFARARSEGLHAVAHAGEEGPPEYISGALDLLGAERIDHGVRCLEHPALVARLRDDAVPLTVCPLSNVKLAVVARLEDHPLPKMIDAGLVVTINSDDPAYFGGYVGDNYVAVHEELGLDLAAMVALARASIEASFAAVEVKHRLLTDLETYIAATGGQAAG